MFQNGSKRFKVFHRDKKKEARSKKQEEENKKKKIRKGQYRNLNPQYGYAQSIPPDTSGLEGCPSRRSREAGWFAQTKSTKARKKKEENKKMPDASVFNLQDKIEMKADHQF